MSEPIASKFADQPDESTDNSVLLQATEEGVAVVLLNRPARKNAFDARTIAALREAFDTLAGAEGVRVVFLRGAEGCFSAGADLDWMREAGEKSQELNREDALELAEMLKALYDLPMLTVALVEGVAYGGGAGLVAACDMSAATKDARFAFSEAKIGLTPATIAPYVVAAIGPRNARRLFCQAPWFDAAEAHRIGLIDHVVEDGAALDALQEKIAADIFAVAPEAMAECKALIAAVDGKPIDRALMEDTARRIAARRASPEGKEGLKAFLEKRKPNWMG